MESRVSNPISILYSVPEDWGVSTRGSDGLTECVVPRQGGPLTGQKNSFYFTTLLPVEVYLVVSNTTRPPRDTKKLPTQQTY